MLLVAKSLNWIEMGSLAGWVVTEEHADRDGEGEPTENGREGKRVPFVGNPLILLLGTCLFLLSTLGLGLLISTLAKTQQQAFAANFFVVNPVFTLSGFSFPIASMPEPLQWLTYIDPLRYFLVVIRATFLKGVGLDALWPDMLGMAVLGTGFLGISVMRFRKSLD